jgi:DTW domain-containing protein YfiP
MKAHTKALRTLPPQERRAAQVSLLLSRDQHKSSGHCVCGTLPAYCFCSELANLSPLFSTLHHHVSVFLHPRELHRNNSTHHLIQLLLQGRCSTVVVAGCSGGEAAPSAASPSPAFSSCSAAYAAVLASCAATGATPVVLFPSASAASIPAWQAAALPTPASPAHIILLDSTWSESLAMSRELAALGASFVSLALPPAGLVSLFQACRRQPMEGKVCTAEALAYMLHELRGGGVPPTTLPPQQQQQQQPPSPLAVTRLHTALLPALRSAHSQALLHALAVSVDRQTKQMGMLGGAASRGPGFRTWQLGVEGAGPFLGAVPAHVLERVCEYAYGPGAVCPSGFFRRFAGQQSRQKAGGSSGSGGGAAEAALEPWQARLAPLAQCSKALAAFAQGQWLLSSSRR